MRGWPTGTPQSQRHIRRWMKHLSAFVHSVDLARALAAPGSGDEDDKEHRRKYVVETDKYFADDRLVPPPVIGENNQR